MHDPMTVAFDIHGPRGLLYAWKRYRLRNRKQPYGDVPYATPIATIWHVDPERDGSDDSCGWSRPKVSREQRERIEKLADSEFDFMFGKYPELRQASIFETIYAVWRVIAWREFNRRELTFKEMTEIVDLAANPMDNLRRVVIGARYEQKENRDLFRCVLRAYLRLHRPWYRHPRWHLHHWKIQIRGMQKIQRFLFSRCAGCGKRFAYGYCPTSNSWHSLGPQWFKSERNVYHHECVPGVRQKVAA